MPQHLTSLMKRVVRQLIPVLIPDNPVFTFDDIADWFFGYMNRMLIEQPPLTRFFLKMGFVVFEYAVPFFGFGFQRFSSLSDAKKEKYTHKWAHNKIVAIREIFKALKGFLLVIYFAERRIWNYVGYFPEPYINERIALRQEILNK
ncbi:hypothetical protein K1X76_06450 [bacterium]|nr:hypothetical protein [bacterium]